MTLNLVPIINQKREFDIFNYSLYIYQIKKSNHFIILFFKF